MTTIEAWYTGLPIVTRSWLTCAGITGLMFTLQLPYTHYLMLSWHDIIYSFQLWRLFTCFLLFGKLGMNWLFAVYMMCQYVRALESNEYAGVRGLAELLFLCAYGVISVLLTSLVLPCSPGVALLSIFIYIWSRKEPHAPINVYGFAFQRWHMPMIIIALSFLMGMSIPFDPITGAVLGHLWLFLTEIVPRIYRRTLIRVPEWWYQLTAKHLSTYVVGGLTAGNGPMQRRDAAAPAAAPARQWMTGQGHRLGD